MLETYILSAICILVFFSLVWAYAQKIKDNSIADIAWGIGFCIVALVSCIYNQATTTRQLMITLFALLWGCRLAVHIWTRKRGNGEDFRYRAMRKRWGKRQTILSLFEVFLLQGFLLLLIASPIILVNSTPQLDLSWLDYIAIAVFDLGFTFEVLGDYQLGEFIKNPENKGKLLQSGLWKYTRHPNYFGEVTLWWGMWIFALSSTLGIFTFISPLLITVLLLKVSGIPLLEKRYEGSIAFEEYKKKTSAFFPWFPKKSV